MPVSWDEYLQEVLPECQGCPVRMAINAIRNAAIEFVEQSRSYREVLPDLTLTQSQDTYTFGVAAALPTPDIIIPDGTSMLGLHKAQLVTNGQRDDKPLFTIPLQHQDRFRIRQAEDRPYYYYQRTPDQVTFIPIPDGNQTYVVELQALLHLSRDSTEAPDWLYDNWLEEVAHGAKFRLKAMSGRGWENLDMVPYHRREFYGGINEARIRDSKSNVMSSSTADPQRNRFGHYRRRRGYFY